MIDDDQKRVDKYNKARELELLSIRNIMKTEGGRAFMWQCLQNCHTFESIFNIDPVQHAYTAGARGHGVWLDNELREAATDDYYKMLKENRND